MTPPRNLDEAKRRLSAIEWQPIETAPKDGTLVLLCGNEWMELGSHWPANMHWTVGGVTGPRITQPITNWLPLPPPPAAAPTSERKEDGRGMDKVDDGNGGADRNTLEGRGSVIPDSNDRGPTMDPWRDLWLAERKEDAFVLAKSCRHAANESGRYTNANRRLIEAADLLECQAGQIEAGRRFRDLQIKEIDRLKAENERAWQQHEAIALQCERLREALEEISEGKGRFSMDQFEHARNTIEDMKAIARAALQRQGGVSDG